MLLAKQFRNDEIAIGTLEKPLRCKECAMVGLEKAFHSDFGVISAVEKAILSDEGGMNGVLVTIRKVRIVLGTLKTTIWGDESGCERGFFAIYRE